MNVYILLHGVMENGMWLLIGEYSSSSYATISSNSLLFQGLVTYNKEWGIHSIDAMIGASQETFSQNKSYQKQSNFPNDKKLDF